MPRAPPRKQPINVQAAALGDIPPFCSELLAEGIMLKSAEKSMTPKLRLSDDDKNISLSCILKLRLLGNFLMIISTQMMEAPMMHATVTVN